MFSNDEGSIELLELLAVQLTLYFGVSEAFYIERQYDRTTLKRIEIAVVIETARLHCISDIAVHSQ